MPSPNHALLGPGGDVCAREPVHRPGALSLPRRSFDRWTEVKRGHRTGAHQFRAGTVRLCRLAPPALERDDIRSAHGVRRPNV
ncbi:hypothetical protein MTBUT4_100050 [Magnetospirillum sp. UT-4]|nr:hypothetical protein MTBUT4_100050 [Magnetospirillum sp. UT-4]